MDVFRQVVDTNLYGCVYPVKAALPYLKVGSQKRKSEIKGHIVVFSSYSGEFGLPYRTSYCASKFAVNGFFESLKMELGDFIDITMICPITVETEFRSSSLIKAKETEAGGKAASKVSAEDAVDRIIEASDRRDDKLIWPMIPSIAQKFKNLFPNSIATLVKSRAKL